ncbi:sulfonate ABC transporter substrate-binding protein [Leptolyngbya sp. NK1-12]|uniref:Putative aliphatic sulfonates-binding protein n=1 Tax=Leptolyngbya sp. NK1-12 TaxID=2547451 RepID=A0AA97AJT7_9CYAN|nr:sulfonate ABC transporter substrate-binding protein [Leptolyngbya sp. NK1-12]WNZ26999.1 sulfonate ABC transporter substrate-binding protein [Leptolyngbya sp. NK1-12]
MLDALQQSLPFRWVRRCFQALPRRPFTLLFAVGLGLSLITAACSPNSTSSSTTAPAAPTQSVEVRIGYQKAATILNVLRTREDLAKTLADSGATVSWAEFPAGQPMLEALNAGSIDFGYTGEAPPIFAQAAGAPLLYVAYDPWSPKAEAIVVPEDSPIQSVADLKGKKVAVAKGSNTNYLLVAALEKAGLKFSDIEPAYLPPADARSAFEGRKVDAWAIWDPFLAVAESTAGARVIVDATGLAPNRGYYLASKSFVEQHPEQLKAVLDSVKQVSDWAAKNPTEVAEFLAPELKIDPAPLEKAEKRREYGVLPITDDVINDQQKIADTFQKIGLIPQKINVREVIWTEK